MNRAFLFAGIAAAVVGAPAIAAAAPAWCGNAHATNYQLDELSSKDAERVITTLAKATCSPTDEAKAEMADIDAARAAWGKRLGMEDADWADAVAYTNAPKNSITWDYSSKNLAQFTPLDQYKAISERFHAQGGNDYADDTYIADALEANMTEAGRVAFIERCIQSNSSNELNDAAAWAICQGDIQRFDAGKFATELRADTAHPAEARMLLRLHMYAMAAKLKDHADDVAKVVAKDPIYKKMFELAEKGRGEWKEQMGGYADLLALATDMDSATFFQSRNGFEGCEAKTDAALRAAAAKLPAKSFAKMYDQKEDPTKGFAASAGPIMAANSQFHLAAAAYVQCQPTTALSEYLSSIIQPLPGQRGPRINALARIINAKLQPDDMNAKVYYPHFDTRPYRMSHGTTMSWGGVVKTAKPSGDYIDVEFEKETFKQEDCVSEHHTNHIAQILDSGTVMYETICDKTAMVTHDRTFPPIKVDPAFEKLLKPGVRISVIMNSAGGGGHGPPGSNKHRAPKSSSKERTASVIAVWASKSATSPSSILGATVK